MVFSFRMRKTPLDVRNFRANRKQNEAVAHFPLDM
jgi:hypothetical protein